MVDLIRRDRLFRLAKLFEQADSVTI